MPWMVPVAMAATALGQMAYDKWGKKKPNTTAAQMATPYAQTEDYDPTAFNYQGVDPVNYRETGAEAQNRYGEQIDTTLALGDRNRQLQDRGQQIALAQDLQAAAAGEGPSIAQAQLQAGSDQSIANQFGLASSARGGALAQAAAQRLAMQNAGTQTAQLANQSAQLRAQEQVQARGELANQLGRLRSDDAGMGSQAFTQAATQAQLNAAQRSQNDALLQFYEQHAQGAQAEQSAGARQREQFQSTGTLDAQALSNQATQQNNQLAAAQQARTDQQLANIGTTLAAGAQMYGQGTAAKAPAASTPVAPAATPPPTMNTMSYQRPAPAAAPVAPFMAKKKGFF